MLPAFTRMLFSHCSSRAGMFTVVALPLVFSLPTSSSLPVSLPGMQPRHCTKQNNQLQRTFSCSARIKSVRALLTQADRLQ